MSAQKKTRARIETGTNANNARSRSVTTAQIIICELLLHTCCTAYQSDSCKYYDRITNCFNWPFGEPRWDRTTPSTCDNILKLREYMDSFGRYRGSIGGNSAKAGYW